MGILSIVASNIDEELQKRDWYDGDGAGAGRYAFFAFFAAAIIIFLVLTCSVNIRRIRQGRKPIISHYLAPPSYQQSQVQYEGQTATSLPTYYQAPNPEQDAGYYDANGNFVPAQNKPINNQDPFMPPTPDASGMERAHTQDGGPESANTVNDMTYSRPAAPPPPPESTSGTNPVIDEILPDYSPPSGPPPSHIKS